MTSKQRKFAFISLCLTFIAILLHGYLANKYFDLKFGADQGEPSLCNINEVFNCDAVSTSKYATFLGIPIALWGFAFNLIFAFLQSISILGWSRDTKTTQGQTFIVSWLIGLASVVMGIISLSLVQQVCLFCIAAYFLSWGAILLWWLAIRPIKSGSLREDTVDLFSNSKWVIGCLLAVPFMAFVFNSMLLDKVGGKEIETLIIEKYNTWATNPPQNFQMDKGLVLNLSPSTPKKMVIVEFADFLCPHCKVAKTTLHAFVEAHPQDVELVFKTFPLDGTCNLDPVFEGKGDGIRCRLALATFCSESLFKKGWATHNFIFDNQESFYSISKDDADKKICDGVSLDCTVLKACMDSDTAKRDLSAMAKEGTDARISGTPSIFVNNRSLPNGQGLPFLRKVYESLK
ncbi:MAG: vitamin K epoxide reductase family protein [Bdellovibrionota bacterium]